MKTIISAICLSLAITPMTASQDISPYVSAKIGGGISSAKNMGDTPLGGGIAGAVGIIYDMPKMNRRPKINLRAEIEISKFQSKDDLEEDDYPFDKSNYSYRLDSALYMANFYIDFLTGSKKIAPYAGIGVGLADFAEKNYENLHFYGTNTDFTTNERRAKTVPAMGVMAGFSFNIIKSLTGDIGAYCQIFAIEDRIIACSANLGLRYNF